MGTLKHANPSANQRSLNRKTNRKNRSTMSWQVSVVANLLLIKISTSCWSMSACYSSCFSQHKKHPKKLSNTSVKDKALGFQLHQQPRQLLSVFLVLAKLFMALHSKSFSEIGVCPCPCIPKNPRPWHVAETHTTMGIITMHTLTKIQQNIK